MAKEVSERRKSPRIDARLALQVEKKLKGGGERPHTTESLNLSSGGLYCHLRSYLAPLTKVGLTLLLPSFGRQGKKTQVINCEGVVVRCEAEESDSTNYEVACCFTDVRREDRQLIEEYIGWRLMRDLIDERLSRP
jgi:c-di-GMP-binding flagellar brake protein YcgR